MTSLGDTGPNGDDGGFTGAESRRRPARRRIELAATLLIPALVVGAPLLANHTGGRAAVGAGSPRAAETTTTSAAAADPSPPAGTPGPTGAPALNGLLTAADSVWDLYLVAGPPPPTTVPATRATSPPGSSTSTTGTTSGSGPAPTPTSPPTMPAMTATTAGTLAVTPPAATPRAPTNLALDFDSPSLTATWDATRDNIDGTGLDDLRAYEITFGAGGRARTYETVSPRFTYSFTQNGLDFGTPQPQLTVTVRAVAAGGSRSGPLTGLATNAVPATPTVPPLLTVQSTGGTVTVAASSGVEDLAGFDVYYSTSSVTGFDLIGSTAGLDPFSHAVGSGTHHYLYTVRDVFGQVSPGSSPSATATIP